MARAGESGRDRNYLVHALLSMARTQEGDQKQKTLCEAEKVLQEA